jgi:hypothetical protein
LDITINPPNIAENGINPHPSLSTLPAKMLLLERSENAISNTGECERKFEANITTKHRTNLLSDRSNKPDLSHAHDSTEDTEAECSNGCKARWEFGGLIIDFGCVATEATLEDDVFWEGDAFVDGEPVALKEDAISKGVEMIWHAELTINNMKFSRAASKLL